MHRSAALFIALLATPSLGEDGARFEGKVFVEWLADSSGPDRDMKLLEPFRFIDAHGEEWSVPAGAVINGASIPKAFWTVVGSPFVGDYRFASVVHDYHCQIQKRPWQAVHRMFLDASIAGGVGPKRAKLLYAAVFGGGPRWPVVAGVEPGTVLVEPVIPDFSEADLRELEEWINIQDPALQAVEAEVQRLITD